MNPRAINPTNSLIPAAFLCTGVKRVVVIVAAFLFFAHPVSMQNAIGTAMALGGVFAYSQVWISVEFVWGRQGSIYTGRVLCCQSGPTLFRLKPCSA